MKSPRGYGVFTPRDSTPREDSNERPEAGRSRAVLNRGSRRKRGLRAVSARRKSVKGLSVTHAMCLQSEPVLSLSMQLNTHSLSVLIIDDDPDISRMVATSLRRSGCSLSSTLKSKEGVALVRKINPDVILCDGDMPGLSGAQVIEILKSDPATAHIPVIFMTGFAGPEMFTHVRWDGFLSKPFSSAELIAALHNVVASAAAKTESTASYPSPV